MTAATCCFQAGPAVAGVCKSAPDAAVAASPPPAGGMRHPPLSGWPSLAWLFPRSREARGTPRHALGHPVVGLPRSALAAGLRVLWGGLSTSHIRVMALASSSRQVTSAATA